MIRTIVIGALAFAACDDGGDRIAETARYKADDYAECVRICPKPLVPALMPSGQTGFLSCACFPACRVTP